MRRSLSAASGAERGPDRPGGPAVLPQPCPAGHLQRPHSGRLSQRSTGSSHRPAQPSRSSPSSPCAGAAALPRSMPARREALAAARGRRWAGRATMPVHVGRPHPFAGTQPMGARGAFLAERREWRGRQGAPSSRSLRLPRARRPEPLGPQVPGAESCPCPYAKRCRRLQAARAALAARLSWRRIRQGWAQRLPAGLSLAPRTARVRWQALPPATCPSAPFAV